ncbi:MAG: hypothetical protein NUV90_00455 [Candidatus Parcubacteria bacterium]|nr:hypothetical protein [Candidatus Parcubacteria bacterium]
MKSIIGVMCLLLALCTEAFGEGAFCQVPTGTVVVFGNGIMGTQKDAVASRNKLHDTLRATLTSDEFNKLEFDLAYNQSYGLISDLYESLKQKLSSDNVVVSFWRWLGNREEIPALVREALTNMATRFDFSTHVGTGDLDNHLTLYRASILAGKKVVVVAHSQGNFFANAAYELLHSGTDSVTSRSFGIVSVANPASFVGGDGPYTTLIEDVVIQAIALATPVGALGPIAPNATKRGSSVATSDWSGHNFLLEYMAAGSNTIGPITQNVVGMMSSLEQPLQRVQDGIITAILTWGAQPDVDLHVFEPGGSHVFYGNFQGISGYLDLDDTSSFGPEHYYVACTALSAGVYSIGVNYFYGLAPETAQLQITAGTIVRNYTIPLATVSGEGGDASPIPVAEITVTGDASRGFQFAVSGAP